MGRLSFILLGLFSVPNRNIVAAGLLASAASLVLACGSGGRTTPPATTSQTTSLILSSIVPNQGTTGGGTKVSIHGAGFAGGAQVNFGGTPGQTTFMSSQKLVAIVPPHSSGVVDVTVTNSNGATSTMRGSFTFVDPPFNDVTQESGIDFLCLGGEQIIKVACGALAADFDNFHHRIDPRTHLEAEFEADAEGAFEICGVPAGKLSLQRLRPGTYGPGWHPMETVEIVAGQTTTVD